MSYRDEFKSAEKQAYWSFPRIIFGLFVIAIGFGVLNFITLPGQIASRTLNADNIINNYEWFHDTNNAFIARTGQIATHKTIITGASDAQEKSRLTIELAAMQQSCRELVGKYNANATKSNRSIFMGTTTPVNLDMKDCE
jgi:hypothetical protein